MDLHLKDRVVFITGGASGIGASEVTHFAAQGARVAFIDIDDAAAEALVARIAAAGHPAPFFQHCDVRDIPALQAKLKEPFGVAFDSKNNLLIVEMVSAEAVDRHSVAVTLSGRTVAHGAIRIVLRSTEVLR